jgi:8-oxo-dGTP pyrophosphatase MutT (NUDIX family)
MAFGFKHHLINKTSHGTVFAEIRPVKESIQPKLLDLLDEIRAIAQLGINYSKDPYDLSRYNRLLELAATEYAPITGWRPADQSSADQSSATQSSAAQSSAAQPSTGLSPEAIRQRFTRELGYITPKIGVQGALFDADGKILLEQRIDDALWGLPAGWVEVGERPETAVIREFQEETGLSVEPVAILGFYTRLPGEYQQPHTSVHILYACDYLGGNLRSSHESLQMAYCDPSTIEHWHKDHRQQVEAALQFRKTGKISPFVKLAPAASSASA